MILTLGRCFVLTAAVPLLVGCGERSDPLTPAEPAVPSGPSESVGAIACTGNRALLTLRCDPSTSPGAASRGIILPGENGPYVRLTASNVSYDPGTRLFGFDFAVQNLMEQPIGTTDGITRDPDGIQVFILDMGVRRGSVAPWSRRDSIEVIPDALGTFTAAWQPYYQYDVLLMHNEASPPRRWQLRLPPKATEFHVRVMVSTRVPYPAGYLTLNGYLPGVGHLAMRPGDTHRLAVVERDWRRPAAAIPVADPPIFATTDSECARVDDAGVVTAVGSGTCTITATSSSFSERWGSITVMVAHE